MTETKQDFNTMLEKSKSQFELRCKYFDLWMKTLDEMCAVGQVQRETSYGDQKLHELFMTAAKTADIAVQLFRDADDAYGQTDLQIKDYFISLKTETKNDQPS